MADTRLTAFSPPGSTAYATVRADALGVWTEHDRTVAFYLEHDTGTENLTVLTDKLHGYRDLVRRGGPAWPVLFWLHSTTREAHLHHRLSDTGGVPIATAARDRLDGRSVRVLPHMSVGVLPHVSVSGIRMMARWSVLG